jgi:hypothetical protein
MTNEEQISCTKGLSRKQFLRMVIQRATIAGVILAGPKVIDKFLVPPANAMMPSTGGGPVP